MKFGETLHKRSIPQWATYNVNYNEIKRLIKERTSIGPGVPVAIPNGSSNNRWVALEDDLFVVLKDQHDNISLFLKSKYGEIDRRLTYLEKQVRSAQKLTAASPIVTPNQGRRFHKLMEDAESIGQDIQNLTRFASVQKTAFRKLLKKYRKWTSSTSLQIRLENEVFAAGQLNLDYAHPLERLAVQGKIITERIQGSILRRESFSVQDRLGSPTTQPISTVSQLIAAQEKGSIALDAALATIPYGKSAGSATYWIHPDNLDEAQALLLRHVREIHKTKDISRESSSLSVASATSRNYSITSVSDKNHIAYFDNTQRFLQDESANRPSKIAFSGRWSSETAAIVTLSNLAPWNPSGNIIDLKRKEMLKALSRDEEPERGRQTTKTSGNVQRVLGYLSEHRDVKSQAHVQSTRSRFVGTGNSSQAGTWATLDSELVISPLRNVKLDSLHDDEETGDAFPYAVLDIRWEFGHTPEVVRLFDSSHLAERVKNFTIESAAIHSTNKELAQPSWKLLLEKDIRKVPITTKSMSAMRSSTYRVGGPITGTSSGPSSTDGPADSIFSAQNVNSSATSVQSPGSIRDEQSLLTIKPLGGPTPKKKKKARIDAESPPPRASRYWNEFDDGDEDVNPQEAYIIYVDPDQSFPGVETVSKVFGAMYQSLESATSRISSLISLKPRDSPKKKRKLHDQSRLLYHSGRSSTDEGESSDSDTTPTQEVQPSFGTFTRPKPKARTISTASRAGVATTYRPHQLLTPRQQALEHTYFMFYTGLIVLSYILLFVSGVLLSAARRRAYVEVDIAVITAISTAEICAVLAIILVWMRKSPLSIVHWAIVSVAITGIFIVGVAEVVGIVNRSVRR